LDKILLCIIINKQQEYDATIITTKWLYFKACLGKNAVAGTYKVHGQCNEIDAVLPQLMLQHTKI